jgi:hypothetical protein
VPAVAAGLLLTTAACGHENDRFDDRVAPSPSLTMIQTPTLPPSGTLDVAMQESSHDRAHHRMEALITNGTSKTVHPQRIVYDDPRLTAPITAGRLRAMPPTSHRQFPLPLPEPRCDGPRPDPDVQDAKGTLRITAGGETQVRPVTDVNDDMGRYTQEECFRQAVAKVVDLQWSDRVEDGNLQLDVTPTGAPGTVTLLGVQGTYLFGPEHGGSWPAHQVLTDRPVRFPILPVRCDGHAFSEGGTATTFRVHLRTEGVDSEFEIPMSERGKRAMIAYGLHTCGLS